MLKEMSMKQAERVVLFAEVAKIVAIGIWMARHLL